MERVIIVTESCAGDSRLRGLIKALLPECEVICIHPRVSREPGPAGDRVENKEETG